MFAIEIINVCDILPNETMHYIKIYNAYILLRLIPNSNRKFWHFNNFLYFAPYFNGNYMVLPDVQFLATLKRNME